MKRILLSIILVLAWVTESGATVYYGGAASKNINADDLWYEGVTGSCAGDGSPVAWATVNQAGNTLVANGCTITIPNTANLTVTVDKITNQETDTPDADCVDGGTFTYTTSADYTLTITAGSGGVVAANGTGNIYTLNISGSAAGADRVTINGNLTGGNSSGNMAVYDQSTSSIKVVGNLTGGTNANGRAYHQQGSSTISITGDLNGTANGTVLYAGAAGTITITGNANGGASYAIYNNSTGTVTVNGNVTGSNSSGAVATHAASTGPIIITGNIIHGTRGTAVSGTIRWQPSDTTKYIKFNGGGTAVWAGISAGCTSYTDCTGAPAVTKIGTNFLNNTDGTMDPGTLSGGGGAWPF